MPSGIYKITCYNNGKFYIGSSISIDRRLKEHIRLLNKNKHNNLRLQKAWNEYGEKNFRYEIVETIYNINQLSIREKLWIDNTNCCDRKIGFNISSNPYTLGMGRFIDLTGQKFGRLLVINYIGKDEWSHNQWLCRCNCGKEMIIIDNNLKSGHTKSCGCLKIKFAGSQNLKHGKSKSRIHKIWRDMLQRCNNPNNPAYKNYGGRKNPIKVCYRWSNKNLKGFQNFYADVGDPPRGLIFGRINTNEGYKSNNWRWATKKEQNRNTKSNRNYFVDGKNQCLSDIAKKYKIHPETLRNRINKDFSIEEALTIPVRERRLK